MSELSRSSPYRSTPDAPVSESERARLSDRLNAAFERGAVDADDYKARLDVLFAAQRMGDLVPVVDGLPPVPTHDTPAIVASSGGQPGQLSPTRSGGGLTMVTIAAAGVALLLLIVIVLVLAL